MVTNKYADVNLGTVKAVFNKLGGVEGVRRFLAGDVEVTIKDHIVNCNADPSQPGSRKVRLHKKQGELKLTREGDKLFLDGKQIDFYRSKKQMGKSTVKGNDLRKELDGLKNKILLNACVLDYLCEHPHLIPDSWKKDKRGNIRYIFFWGTDYGQYVRYLCWEDGKWDCCGRVLEREWDFSDHAAVLAV